MDPTPKNRPRNALRWIVGVGLVFVVVVGATYQIARSRADERWESVMVHLGGDSRHVRPNRHSGAPKRLLILKHESGSDGSFRGRRDSLWEGEGSFALAVWQERRMFGRGIEARMSGGSPGQIDAVRALFDAVDIELVVEP